MTPPIRTGSMHIEIDPRESIVLADRLPADAIGQMSIVGKYGDAVTVTLTDEQRHLLIAALTAL